MRDDLGTRMKENYENRTRFSLPRRTYTIIRLDGKAFHTFTKGMKKPFDKDFIDVMDGTAKFLCEEIQGAKMAYVQSDEISILLTDFEKTTTDAWFDGNIQKIVSVSASLATARFNRLFRNTFIRNQKALRGEIRIITMDDRDEPGIFKTPVIDLDSLNSAFFDSRVFTIPDPIEVENYFIWRQKDAVRNSIAMTAQSLYSDTELKGKSQSVQQEMIHTKGKNWNDLYAGFKRGRLIEYDYVYSEELAEEFRKRNPIQGRMDVEYESDMDDAATRGQWVIKDCPDFLKEREVFKNLIPRIM